MINRYMINITLPGLYNNFTLNNNLKNLYLYHTNYFKIQNLNFNFIEGNFPFCYWNGGFNSNTNNGVLYNDILNISNNTTIPLRFNCSNLFLKKEDFNDTLGNLILQINENIYNSIELSNIDFYYFLKKKYPNYKYILSKDIFLISDISINLINDLINDFYLIHLPLEKTIDFDFLKKIKNKNKIELSLNIECMFNCNKYKTCLLHEHQSQYNFLEDNNFKICNSFDKNKIISLEEINKYFVPLGFNNFIISNITKQDYKQFLIEYFIKDEYKFLVSTIL